jgi:ADP-ribose pyrophosphatase YjhB (NUDIX family)
METISEVSGIIIREKKLFIQRSQGKDFFTLPGGPIGNGETPEQTLVSDLQKKFHVRATISGLRKFGTFSAPAMKQPSKMIIMHAFMVTLWEGNPVPINQADKIFWIDSHLSQNAKLGSILENQIMPLLKTKKLIH